LDGRVFQVAGNDNLYFQSTGPLYLQLRGKATLKGLKKTQTSYVHSQKLEFPRVEGREKITSV